MKLLDKRLSNDERNREIIAEASTYSFLGTLVLVIGVILLGELQELRQKAHTELARLQPWDEWRLRGKTYCSLNLILIQCVYEPNI